MRRASTALARVGGALLCLLVASTAAAQRRRVEVTVTDVAGERAYVTPGSSAGVERGVSVVIDERPYEVVEATESYASIAIGQRVVRIGDRGVARVPRRAAEPTAALPPVEELSEYRDLWQPAARPSESQHPDYVPLTARSARRPVSLVVSSTTGVRAPVKQAGEALVRQELRARLHVEPIESAPLALDVDAALQLYFADDVDQRAGSGSRPIAEVRQLSAAYGMDDGFYAALGRLRYAASTVGLLDGARLRTPSYSGVSVGAFGGLVPNPKNGVPSADASRFGVELQYQDLERAWRPYVSLVVHGSMYDGSIDERRLSGTAHLFPGDTSIGSYFELAYHGSGNPWGVPATELTAAGVDVSSRHGRFRWGVRGDYRHPERSRWLTAQLPAGYLCVAPRQSTEPTDVEPCGTADDARYMGGGDLGGQWRHVAVSAGGTYTATPAADAFLAHGFAQVRAVDLWGVGRADATVAVAHGSFMDAYSLRVGLGAALLDGRLDLGAHYRPTLREYVVDSKPLWDHLVGGNLYVVASPEWQLALDADAFLGRDVSAVLLMASIVWRPELGGSR